MDTRFVAFHGRSDDVVAVDNTQAVRSDAVPPRGVCEREAQLLRADCWSLVFSTVYRSSIPWMGIKVSYNRVRVTDRSQMFAAKTPKLGGWAVCLDLKIFDSLCLVLSPGSSASPLCVAS